MADKDFEALLNVLASSKEVFWAENAHVPEEERQRRWNDRFGQLANQLCIAPQSSQCQPDDHIVESSISLPPAKRPALVSP